MPFSELGIHCVYGFTRPKAMYIIKQIPIDADSIRTQNVNFFEIGIFGPKAVLDTSPLSSGQVRRTRCQISAGANAPVAPVLTRSSGTSLGSSQDGCAALLLA